MKQKYIPLEKQSKRKLKEQHATQRRDWGSISPVTRKVENGKAYNRKKSKQRWHDLEPGLGFLFWAIQQKSGEPQLAAPLSLPSHRANMNLISLHTGLTLDYILNLRYFGVC